MTRTFCWLAAVVASLLFSHPISADNIYFKKGGAVRNNVEVLEENYQKILYKEEKRPNPIPLSSDLIDRIEYSDTPRDFADAMTAFNLGNYEDAVSLLEVAQNTQGVRGWLTQYVSFHLARAYHAWAESSNYPDPQKYEKAVGHYQKTLESAPETRFLFACHLYTAQCYLFLKKYNEAKQSLAILQSIAKEKSKDATWLFLSLFWQGHVAIAENDYAAALSRYRDASLISLSKENDSLRDEAVLAIGDCYVTQKDFVNGMRHFEKIELESAADRVELKAGAKNGIAACYFEKGEILKARILAIETILKYPGAVSQQAKSLFLAAKCYEKLADKEKGARARSKVYYQLLATGHSSTELGRKAAKILQRWKEK